MLVFNQTETLEEYLVEEQKKEKHQLIVFNDEVNTFEHVIDTLIDVCKHDTYQAEQCTYIIHYNGKCSVKEGEFDKLIAMSNNINSRGINATVI